MHATSSSGNPHLVALLEAYQQIPDTDVRKNAFQLVLSFFTILTTLHLPTNIPLFVATTTNIIHAFGAVCNEDISLTVPPQAFFDAFPRTQPYFTLQSWFDALVRFVKVNIRRNNELYNYFASLFMALMHVLVPLVRPDDLDLSDNDSIDLNAPEPTQPDLPTVFPTPAAFVAAVNALQYNLERETHRINASPQNPSDESYDSQCDENNGPLRAKYPSYFLLRRATQDIQNTPIFRALQFTHTSPRPRHHPHDKTLPANTPAKPLDLEDTLVSTSPFLDESPVSLPPDQSPTNSPLSPLPIFPFDSSNSKQQDPSEWTNIVAVSNDVEMICDAPDTPTHPADTHPPLTHPPVPQHTQTIRQQRILSETLDAFEMLLESGSDRTDAGAPASPHAPRRSSSAPALSKDPKPPKAKKKKKGKQQTPPSSKRKGAKNRDPPDSNASSRPSTKTPKPPKPPRSQKQPDQPKKSVKKKGGQQQQSGQKQKKAKQQQPTAPS